MAERIEQPLAYETTVRAFCQFCGASTVTVTESVHHGIPATGVDVPFWRVAFAPPNDGTTEFRFHACDKCAKEMGSKPLAAVLQRIERERRTKQFEPDTRTRKVTS